MQYGGIPITGKWFPRLLQLDTFLQEMSGFGLNPSGDYQIYNITNESTQALLQTMIHSELGRETPSTQSLEITLPLRTEA